MSRIIETFLKTFSNKDDLITLRRSELKEWKFKIRKETEEGMQNYWRNYYKKSSVKRN